MTKDIRWGILGLGSIAGVFAAGLQAVPNAQLVACGSRTAEKAEAFGEKWKIPHRHADYAALAADPEVDAIYVATPHPMHREDVLLCLEHGKAVLCEKPFTVNAREAAEVIAAARRAGLLVMEAMWTRFLPHMAQVRAWLNAGAIGDVRMLHADLGFRANFDPRGRLLNPTLAGGGLLDVGVYTVSLAHGILGVPTAVTGLAHFGETGVDEQAGMVLGYPEGRLAVLSCGVRTNIPHVARILGTEGNILIREPWWRPTSVTLAVNGKEEQTVTPEIVGNGYNYEAVEFGNCLRAGLLESPLFPLDETLAIMHTLDSLRAQWGLKYPME